MPFAERDLLDDLGAHPRKQIALAGRKRAGRGIPVSDSPDLRREWITKPWSPSGERRSLYGQGMRGKQHSTERRTGHEAALANLESTAKPYGEQQAQDSSNHELCLFRQVGKRPYRWLK